MGHSSDKSKAIMFNKKTTNLSISSEMVYRRNSEIITIFNELGNRKNLSRVYPTKVLCDNYIKKRCLSEINGISLYYDDDHLSNEGAKLVVDEVMKFVR